jgi:hypothetical protein
MAKKQIKMILKGAAEDAVSVAEANEERASAAVGTVFPQLAEKGIEGKEWVRMWLEEQQIYGDVEPGNRNNVLAQMVKDMRYVFGSAEELKAALPDWGLPQKEVDAVVRCHFNKPRGTDLPPMMKRVVRRLLGETDEEGHEAAPMNPIPEGLPFLMQFIMRLSPANKEAVLMASLPLLGNLLTRLRAVYLDGNMETPIFMTAIKGTQASGKSFLNQLFELLAWPMVRDDEENRKREMEFKEKMRKARNRKDQPEKETFPIRIVPVVVSNAVLTKRADENNGQSLLSFTTEIDSAMRSMRGGAWAEKSDIYRHGFEGGRVGQDYMSDNSYSASVCLRYNLLFAGTELAVKRFFKNVEDGLNSRFMFANMADDRGQKLVRRRIDPNLMEKARQEVLRLYEMGSSPGTDNEVLIRLPKTLKALEGWTDDRISEYLENGNEALDILRRRSCLIGFRAAMVMYALCGCERKIVVDFALWVATETLNNQMAFFGNELNKTEEECRKIRMYGIHQLRKTKNMKLLSELPEDFAKNDLIILRRKYGVEGECAYIISRWLKAGIVEKQGNRFRKRQR